MRKLNLQEYVKGLETRTLRYVQGFTGSKVKCLHRCSIDGFEWEAAPATIIKGHGCPQCANTQRSEKRKLPLSEYLSRIAGRNTQYVSGYVDLTTKCEHRCRVHGVHWQAKPANVVNGKDCWLCKGAKQRALLRKRHSAEDYERYLITRGLTAEGYVNVTSKCNHVCAVDGFQWQAKPHDIKQGSGCPKCAKYGFQHDQTGTLYFLISEEGYVKVGITGENTSRRMRRLAKSTPFPFAVYRERKGPGWWVARKEKEIHILLANESANLTGFDGCTEWFRSTGNVLKAIHEAMRSEIQ